MRSKADETFVIVETIICPLQMFHNYFYSAEFVKQLIKDVKFK